MIRPSCPSSLFVFSINLRGDSMSAIKIVFFDIDGTLIDMNKKRISEKMLEALRRLK